MRVTLIVLDGRHQGRRIKLPPTQFVIGRDPKCHLRPASRRVSRFHCALARQGTEVLVRDLKSQNGTLVNGRRLESAAARLHHGDMLEVGGFKFQVEIEDAAPAAARPDGDLLWLLDEDQTGTPPAAVPTSQTAYSLEAFDATGASAADAGRSGSNDALIAGDYLQDYAARKSPGAEPLEP